MKTISIILAGILFSGCASVFFPRKQNVTIVTQNDSATVFLNGEEFGIGNEIKGRVKKDGPKQVVIQAAGYKDTYKTLLPDKRYIIFWPLQVINSCLPVPLQIFTLSEDRKSGNTSNYDKVNLMPIPDEYKIVNRDSLEKYIHIPNINLKLTASSFQSVVVKYHRSPEKLQLRMHAALAEVKNRQVYQAQYKKKKSGDIVEEEAVEYDYKEYTKNIYQTLRKTGFIDTVNKIFTDNNNTLLLEGTVNNIKFYTIKYRKWEWPIYRAELDMTWYIRNTYGEVLDSVQTSEFSGEFAWNATVMYATQGWFKPARMYADAIEISYLKLRHHPHFRKYMEQERQFRIKDTLLTIPQPLNPIQEKADAIQASVIVKTNKGHGSGFVISNDGYIITNYHLIAGKVSGSPDTVSVVTSQGEELKATVVRYSVYRDLVLIKVEKTFEKAFQLNDKKTFKTLDNVYTIGAPKSIELGQSMTGGIISTERKTNNNHLIQLGMSVNSGNSGGPVFDESGRLQGVLVAKLIGQNTEGICFAIPGFLIQDYLNIQCK